MKLVSKDNAEGRNHPVKANIQDDIWKMVKTHDVEAEAKGEYTDGIVQETRGQVEMGFPSVYENALVVRPAAWPVMLIDPK